MSHDDGDNDGVEQSTETLLREAQRKLAYYENFGAALQQQMDVVVSQAAAAAQEAEAEQAELRFENDRLRLEVEERRHETRELAEQARILGQEREGLTEELARLRGVQADLEQNTREVGQQLDERRQEREQLSAEVTDLGRESQALVAEMERRRAAEDAETRRIADEMARILTAFQRNAEAGVAEATAALNRLRVQATPQDQVIETGLWGSPPAQPPVVTEPKPWEADGSRDNVPDVESWTRAVAEGWEPEGADGSGEASAEDAADDRAIEVDFSSAEITGERTPSNMDAMQEEGARTQEFYLGRPLFVPSASRPPLPTALESLHESDASEEAEKDDAEGTTTRLLVRPPLDPVKVGELRGALVNLPGVLSAELGDSTDTGSPLLVTHTPETSLLGSLLAIAGLDFRLVSRGDDFIEIELLAVSILPR